MRIARLGRKLALVLLGLVLAAVLFVACFGVPIPYDVEMFSATGYFEDGHPAASSTEVDGDPVGWHATGRNDDAPTVVFVHGSPGSWENFARFLDDPRLAARARLVAIDRFGYGGSLAGTPVRSLATQANAMRPILEDADRRGSPTILVGHSYGGPVVTRAAMDDPGLVDAIVLVAPSMDPALERLPWYQYAGNWFFVRWALPAMLDVSNQEVLALARELPELFPRYADVTIPVTVIQGLEDFLVHPENADFCEERFVNARPLEIIREASAGHFIPWTHDRLMFDAIHELLDRLATEAPSIESPATEGTEPGSPTR